MRNCLDCFHYKACKATYEGSFEGAEFFDDAAHDDCENFINKKYVSIDEALWFLDKFEEVMKEAHCRRMLDIQANEKKTILEQMDEQPWNQKLEVDILKFEPDKVDISKELEMLHKVDLEEWKEDKNG